MPEEQAAVGRETMQGGYRESGKAVSVVIPHLNQPRALARCLASLSANTVPPDEVIVVDNGSARLPEAICAAHPRVRLAREDTPGPGPARNTGVALARGDILAFIDADCIAAPDWIAALRARMDDPAAMVLGGAVLVAPDDPDRPTALEAYEMVFSYRMDRYLRDRGFTGAGNMVIRRAAWDAVGPFAGIETAEDVDWCHRATRAGLPIAHVPALRVWHPARPRLTDLLEKSDRIAAQSWAGLRHRPGGRARLALRALAMLALPAVEAVELARTRRLRGLRARLLAFGVVCRVRWRRARVMAWLVLGGDGAALAGRWNR